jgi:threonine/homoserine/homoserine lactone efflux protein
VSFDVYLAYVLALVVLAIMPGPSVTLIVGNTLRHGTRAGLLNVAGTQAGLAVVIAGVGLGLASVALTLGWWFDWLRLVGAAYLVWLGWKLLHSPPPVDDASIALNSGRSFLLQGFVVAASNPKTLFFFGAFLPQFMNPHADTVPQVFVLGATAMLVIAISDSAYAILAGRAGTLVARRRLHHLSRASGLCLIGGGAWLAFARSR